MPWPAQVPTALSVSFEHTRSATALDETFGALRGKVGVVDGYGPYKRYAFCGSPQSAAAGHAGAVLTRIAGTERARPALRALPAAADWADRLLHCKGKIDQSSPARGMDEVLNYSLPADGHSCEGWSYGQGFAEYMRTRVRDRCTDSEGAKESAKLTRNAKSGGFSSNLLADILEMDLPSEPWKMGECIAECFLEDRKGASLPNPRRTLKNPESSPAGSDLAGFSPEKGMTIFLFGEIDREREPVASLRG